MRFGQLVRSVYYTDVRFQGHDVCKLLNQRGTKLEDSGVWTVMRSSATGCDQSGPNRVSLDRCEFGIACTGARGGLRVLPRATGTNVPFVIEPLTLLSE
jgi:hypothetical protein